MILQKEFSNPGLERHSMVEGIFHNEVIPMIPVSLAWNRGTQTTLAILDTGFSGDLQITPTIARELGIQQKSFLFATMADGITREVPVSLAIAAMENTGATVQVIISEGAMLAGIGLLTKFGYKAIVDCKHKKVQLQKA